MENRFLKNCLKQILLFALSCFSFNILFAESPDEIIKKAKEKFALVKDYETDVNINVNIDFMKVPDASAKFFFKAPDKVKIKSDGFALMPKEGMNFSPQKLTEGNMTYVFVRTEIIDKSNCSVIKIIPMDDNSDVILSTVWIDTKSYIIRKVESSSKTRGTSLVEMQYESANPRYALPTTMKLIFDMKRMNFPKNPQGTPLPNAKKKDNDKNGQTKGIVTVTFKNYKVNKGISDNIFEEKK